MVGRRFGVVLRVLAAVVAAGGTVAVRNDRNEVAIYGNMGTLDENVRPRLTGGWPAPFLADSPHTSVIARLGPEDDFRPGPFVADVAFWYLAFGLSRRRRFRAAWRRARSTLGRSP